MGQYYRPCFINDTKDQVKEYFESWDTENGSKLMEHSYRGNTLVLNVSYRMIDSPKRLVWAGDYGDEVVGDSNFYSMADKTKKAEPLSEIDMMKRELDANTIYINHDKEEWFDLKKQTIPDVWGWVGIAHPLPILTADGNGRGGGDYDGAYMELVGTWKGDLIEVSDTIPANYKEIEPWFTEMEQEEIEEYSKENAPYVLNDVERKKVKDIVARMGKAETELRELINDLKMTLPIGCESFEFDGDVIMMECIKKWEDVLANEIDKFCYFI